MSCWKAHLQDLPRVEASEITSLTTTTSTSIRVQVPISYDAQTVEIPRLIWDDIVDLLEELKIW